MTAGQKSALLVSLSVAAVSGCWVWVMRGHGQGEGGEWHGVDEAVIGRFVEAAAPSGLDFSIAWVRGDLLLFMFLCAGLLTGFVLGYYARSVFAERPAPNEAAERASQPRSERT